MMTGSLKKKKKGGCSVIRACSLIRSNTVTENVNMPSISSPCIHDYEPESL